MKSKKSVYITPIVTRDKTGIELPEIGAGGGKGDLYQIHELELPDEITLRKLEALISEHIMDESVLSQTKDLLKLAFTSKQRALSLDEYGLADDADISLKELASMLSSTRNLSEYRSFEEKYPDMAIIVCWIPQPEVTVFANEETDIPLFSALFLCRTLRARAGL
jgi:hypothetical protein